VFKFVNTVLTLYEDPIYISKIIAALVCYIHLCLKQYWGRPIITKYLFIITHISPCIDKEKCFIFPADISVSLSKYLVENGNNDEKMKYETTTEGFERCGTKTE